MSTTLKRGTAVKFRRRNGKIARGKVSQRKTEANGPWVVVKTDYGTAKLRPSELTPTA